MSAQGEVTEFLRAMKPEGDTLPVTPNQIALQTGISREQVNKTLYNLKAHDRIELLRGPNGREIVGLKVIDLEPRQRGGARPRTGASTPKRERVRYTEPVVLDGVSRRTTSIRTPALDEYGRAKSRFEAMRSDFGELVEATFRENPYAEEGLRLKERLASVEAQFSEVRREKDEVERDYKSLRARRHTEIAEAAEKSGALAKPGD
jgi:biotin operon repressor